LIFYCSIQSQRRRRLSLLDAPARQVHDIRSANSSRAIDAFDHAVIDFVTSLSRRNDWRRPPTARQGCASAKRRWRCVPPAT
jgi:hypothetical protein